MKKLLLLLLMLFVFVGPTWADRFLDFGVNESAEYYKVFVRAQGTTDWIEGYTTETNTETNINLNSITINGAPLEKGVPYEFSIKGYNYVCSESDYSNVVTFEYVIPDAVVLEIDNSILTWTDTYEGVARYILNYNTGTVNNNTEIANNIRTFDLCSLDLEYDVVYTINIVSISVDNVPGKASNIVNFIRRSVSRNTDVKLVGEAN